MNLDGINQKSIRMDNLLKVLRMLAFQGPCSRKDLAQQMGLSKMSITNLVNTFIKEGIVVELKPDDKKHVSVGPRPVLLQIAPGMLVAIGLHITEFSITGQLCDVVEGVLYEKKVPMDGVVTKIQFFNRIRQVTEELIKYGSAAGFHIVSIGITDRHYINRTEGTVVFKGNQLGIDVDGIRNSLERQYNLPVYIENEKLGILLTEIAYGNYPLNKKCYFVYLADEIRGCFISDYYIQKGTVGLSGQLGHMCIKYDGPKCRCGNRGCYENYGSIPALLNDSNCSSIKELNTSLENREPQVLRALENFIQATTVALTNIVNLYDPETIVVVGKAVELDSSVFKKIEYLVNNSFVFRKNRSITISPSKFSEKDYYKGASMVALYLLLTDDNYMRYLYKEIK